jgi:16S rRNA (guanine(1405)-N(7))-methyltransferase
VPAPRRRALIQSEAERICARYRAEVDEAVAALEAAIDRRPSLRELVDDDGISDHELRRRHDFKAATKDAHRRVYFALRRYRREGAAPDLVAVDAAVAAGDRVELRRLARELLAAHTSSRERGDDYPELFRQLGAVLPADTSLIDLGCGLHPLAYLAFDVPRPDRCVAVDRDHWSISVLDRFAAGGPPSWLRPRCADVTVEPLLDDPVDVAVMLKLLPVVERARPGSAIRLLARPQRYVVVTGNVESLTRRDRIAGRERRLLLRLIEGSGRPIVGEIELPTEFGYVLGPARP